ncbi:MAG: tyrosine-type recombinase/integrase [Rhodospirillales bacterium]|nr:tyrosine-type recombinase/integrase [Rhodospirillales bacterium]
MEGTVRAGGRSCRIRRSTGFPADDDHFEIAQTEKNRLETEIINAAVHGLPPTRSFAEAAIAYLKLPRERPLGATQVRCVQQLNKHFGLMTLRSIDETAIAAYFEKHHAGNKPASLERVKNALSAVLVYAKRMKWIDMLPDMFRDEDARNPLRRRRVTDKWLPMEDCFLIIDHAAPHLRPQLAVKFATGCRDPQLASVKIGDFTLDLGRGQVIFRGTKNDDDVVSSLQDWAVECVLEYFQTERKNARRSDPAFLTDKGKPYASSHGRWGGRIKKGFNSARRRAAESLLKQAAEEVEAGIAECLETTEKFERAEKLKRATPHWLRHSMATHMLKLGGDVGSTMDQGGWRDARSLQIYNHDVPEHRRTVVNRIQRPHTPEVGGRN